ncbi:hypothetical protein HID58_078608 [Brassica napus]|uniref:Uncharacterized protein n=1 Tax=Brassica napus TaxID=3708 RepID=A0ABQ7YUL4_BRANA|nr:hypothetical protein HID58_078608 [Brassica napus]
MQFPAILEQKKNQLTQKKKMPRRRITRTLRRRWETMALRDTDLLLLQCSISLHRSHSARDFGLPSANDVFSQVFYPQLVCIFVEFWLISRMKGSPFDDVNCVSSCLGVVMEAKPQLVGIHERVRNDIVHNLLKRIVESEYLLQPIQMQKKLQIS